MKYLAVTLISFSILLLSAARSGIYVSYLLNKEYISKTLCVNRDTPAMHCEGKCHLKKELIKEEQKEQKSPAGGNEKYEINFFYETKSLFLLAFENSNILFAFPEQPIPSGYFFSVFHPPAPAA